MRLRSLAIPSLVLLALGIPVVGAGESQAPAPAQLSETVTIETSDKPLETVLQWISRRAGVNIVCYEQDQPRVTVRLANVTWQEAVESISAKYDLVIEKKSPRVWVLTRPPKVSMSFQDASLPVVLEAIARAADVNIIMAGDVAGSGKRLSMTLKGVPWRYALDVVVKTVDLAWVEQEYNIIRIVSPGSLQKDQRTIVLRVNYGEAKALAESLKPAMGDGSIQIDEVSNSLILTGTPVAMESARKLAEQLDQRTREVLIEMKFVDYSTTDVQGLGFDPISLNFDIDNIGTLNQEFTPFGAGVFTTKTALNRAAGAPVPTNTRLLSASAVFEAIASLSSTDIIQSPQILTLDNTEAQLEIGREIRFAEATQSTSDTGVPTVTLAEAATSPVKDGILIKVRPHITGDGYVQMTLEASNDEAELRTYSSGSGDNAASIQLPNKSITKLKHSIIVGDGRTAVIGGLLKDKEIKQNGHVPGLGTLPVLGFFFRKESQEVEKRNLTIFITPRIIPLGKKTDYDRSLEELKASLSGVREESAKDQQADGQTPALIE
jgi:type IV pilus assembly protein PilQ